MAQVGLVVPGALVPCVRETVVLQYRATVEALHLALGEPGAEVEPARRERARLAQLDALLGQLGRPGERAATGVALSGPAELLRDALHGSLIDAGERLAVACEAGWRGESTPEGIRSIAKEVIALDRLLRELERG
jgi:hypothetical protein